MTLRLLQASHARTAALAMFRDHCQGCGARRWLVNGTGAVYGALRPAREVRVAAIVTEPLQHPQRHCCAPQAVYGAWAVTDRLASQ